MFTKHELTKLIWKKLLKIVSGRTDTLIQLG